MGSIKISNNHKYLSKLVHLYSQHNFAIIQKIRSLQLEEIKWRCSAWLILQRCWKLDLMRVWRLISTHLSMHVIRDIHRINIWWVVTLVHCSIWLELSHMNDNVIKLSNIYLTYPIDFKLSINKMRNINKKNINNTQDYSIIL